MKKIMFNDRYGLTEAVLSGRKTQTRRIIKPQPTFYEHQGIEWRGSAYGLSLQFDEIKGSCKNFITGTEYDKSCNRYRVGEIVAVAQSYKSLFEEDCRRVKDGKPMRNVTIKNVSDHPGWTNKMFVRADQMPHRIRITNVRVERLQDISDEDCLSEGVETVASFYQPNNSDKLRINYYRVPIYCKSGRVLMLTGDTPREAYAALIDRISGKGTWESNPWVLVYDFELVK